MERNRVVSTNIASIGYDEDSLTLEIEFLNGTVYQYFDVPKNIYDELISAGSIGKFFISSIKGYYRFVKV